jgi:hypothetical protein
MEGQLIAHEGKFLKRKNSISLPTLLTDSYTTFDRVRSILSLPYAERTESQISSLLSFTKKMKFFSDLRDTAGEYAHYQCCQKLGYQQCPPGKVMHI